jgi:hypothetical protein
MPDENLTEAAALAAFAVGHAAAFLRNMYGDDAAITGEEIARAAVEFLLTGTINP